MLLTAIYSCGKHINGGNSQANKEVTDFATAYFNYNFNEALKYCTPESEKWIVYTASNIHDADIEVLRNAKQGASVEIKNFVFDDNDSTGYALITVHNYMRLDTIGKAGHEIVQADYHIPIVLRDSKWTVKMEGLPRSEKQNHD